MYKIAKVASTSLIVLLACRSAGCTTPSFTTENEPIVLASTETHVDSRRESLTQLQRLTSCMLRKGGELRFKPSLCGFEVEVIHAAQVSQLPTAFSTKRMFVDSAGQLYIREYGHWRFGAMTERGSILRVSTPQGSVLQINPPSYLVIPHHGPGFFSQWHHLGSLKEHESTYLEVQLVRQGGPKEEILGTASMPIKYSEIRKVRDLAEPQKLSLTQPDAHSVVIENWTWPKAVHDAKLKISGVRSGQPYEKVYYVSKMELGHAGMYGGYSRDPAEMPNLPFGIEEGTQQLTATVQWFPAEEVDVTLDPYGEFVTDKEKYARGVIQPQ